MTRPVSDNWSKDYVKRLQNPVVTRAPLAPPAQASNRNRKASVIKTFVVKALQLRVMQPFKKAMLFLLRGLFHVLFFIADSWLLMKTR